MYKCRECGKVTNDPKGWIFLCNANWYFCPQCVKAF